MPVIEVATFQASEALLADPNLALGSLNILKDAEGFIGAWTGYDIDDKKTAYLIVTWDSLESHKKLQSSPAYPELAEKLRPTLGGPLTITHVEFNNDHTIAFDAPLTEILTHKLKEGKTKEDLDAVIAGLATHFATAEGIRKPSAHGAILETPGGFATVIGWDSLEAYKATSSAETTGAEVAKLTAVVDIVGVKVEFEKRA